MTLKPNALPKQGGTGWVSHLNYEKERNLEIYHSDADSDSDGYRHYARHHFVHDVVVSPTTKEKPPYPLLSGLGGFSFYECPSGRIENRRPKGKPNLSNLIQNNFVYICQISRRRRLQIIHCLALYILTP